MDHPCFGRYSAHRLAPCGGCALRGPCASSVGEPEGFAIIHHPRYAPPVPVARTLARTAVDPSLFNDPLRGVGMTCAGGWWRCRGKEVARVRVLNPGRVEIELILPPPTVASLAAAAHADVFPCRPEMVRVSKRLDRPVTRADAARRKAEVCGSLAVLGNPGDAAKLVVEAVVTCYTEGKHVRI